MQNNNQVDGEASSEGQQSSASPAISNPAANDAGGLPAPPPFRYEARMADHASCPPAIKGPWTGKAYRLIPHVIEPKHFVPQAVANEAILKGKKPKACCSLLSLSMYESADRLKEKVLTALETQPNYLKNLGDHIVELGISANDGERTAANIWGHFDFYERTSFEPMSVVLGHWKLLP